jgi:hypothetical protein
MKRMKGMTVMVMVRGRVGLSDIEGVTTTYDFGYLTISDFKVLYSDYNTRLHSIFVFLFRQLVHKG